MTHSESHRKLRPYGSGLFWPKGLANRILTFVTKRDDVEKLNEALTRLMIENANLRQKNEEAQVIIRRRAPNADGLPIASAVKTILDDRDRASDRISFFRDELKKVMKLLLAGEVKEAKREINQFLFDNPK